MLTSTHATQRPQPACAIHAASHAAAAQQQSSRGRSCRASLGDSVPISERILSRRSSTALLVALPGFLSLSSKTEASPEASRAAEAAELTDAQAEQLTDKDWQQRLTRGQYRVLRKFGTELPLSSPLDHEKRTGIFRCAGCGNEVFNSKAKYDSGTGWPSFYDAIPGAVKLSSDDSIPFMPRTEVSCARCHGHLGHVFADGPQPTGQRYCMNGVAMTFLPTGTAAV